MELAVRRLVIDRHLTERQRTGPNTCKQLIAKFQRRVKLNSRATVCNLPALCDTERPMSATGWQSANVIASSAIRFQIQKGLIFNFLSSPIWIIRWEILCSVIGETAWNPFALWKSAPTTLTRIEQVLSKDRDAADCACLAINSIRAKEEDGKTQGTGRIANPWLSY